MPKIIELTVELAIQRVSCPGVWLCQDGRVSLTVFALGTSYQTCLLPPAFPLMFKDVFYFKKRFEETCALNNICCLLKNETIYCELVQWCEDCLSGDCILLAQYLGSLCDVLFPPNVCSSEGVDLLMRRSKNFPGILSPKIEIATKVRIDEVWNQTSNISPSIVKLTTCHCSPDEDYNRQKQVCHSARYHRLKCQSRLTNKGRSHSCSRSRSRSRSLSESKGSSCSLNQKQPTTDNCGCPNPLPPLGQAGCGLERSRLSHCRDYCVYNVQTDFPKQNRAPWTKAMCYDSTENDSIRFSEDLDDERIRKIVLESRYVDTDKYKCHKAQDEPKKYYSCKVTPCVCEICKRYHQLFHANTH